MDRGRIMAYNELIEERLIHVGASLVGFAELSAIEEDRRRGFPYGISFAVALDPGIVARISTGPHMNYYEEYRVVSRRLNALGEDLEQFIMSLGFRAFSQAAVRQDENFTTPLPHKTAATLAGLGWIGKSATLVNETYGNAIRLGSVLTDMPFEPGTPVTKSRCGDCRLCVDHCPGRAVKGANWTVGTRRDELLDAFACKAEVIRRGIPFGLTEGTCGVCLVVCPYTQRYIEKAAK